MPLYATIVKAQVLFEREGWPDQTARSVMRRLEHIYAKVCPANVPCADGSPI